MLRVEVKKIVQVQIHPETGCFQSDLFQLEPEKFILIVHDFPCEKYICIYLCIFIPQRL